MINPIELTWDPKQWLLSGVSPRYSPPMRRGYSRLMGADEEGTLDRLNAYRREIVDPKIEEQAPRVGAGISSHLDHLGQR